MLLGMLLAVAAIAASPIPSAAVTIVKGNNFYRPGSISRSTSIPSDSVIFKDEEEVLTSISTENFGYYLLSFSLTSLTG